jgi:hypothetical protein
MDAQRGLRTYLLAPFNHYVFGRLDTDHLHRARLLVRKRAYLEVAVYGFGVEVNFKLAG